MIERVAIETSVHISMWDNVIKLFTYLKLLRQTLLFVNNYQLLKKFILLTCCEFVNVCWIWRRNTSSTRSFQNDFIGEEKNTLEPFQDNKSQSVTVSLSERSNYKKTLSVKRHDSVELFWKVCCQIHVHKQQSESFAATTDQNRRLLIGFY